MLHQAIYRKLRELSLQDILKNVLKLTNWCFATVPF